MSEPSEETVHVTTETRKLLGRVLEDFIVRLTLRLVKQGISRKLVVREARAVLLEQFGPGAGLTDVRELLPDAPAADPAGEDPADGRDQVGGEGAAPGLPG